MASNYTTSNTETTYSPQEYVMAFDVDKTYVPEDTGQLAAETAGIIPEENYFEVMERYDQLMQQKQPEQHGSGNQLVFYLSQNPEKIPEIEEQARQLEEIVEPRPGFEQFLEHRSLQGRTNIASSAGYQPLIDAVTNGHFDHVISANIEDGEPKYNGQPQKHKNLQQISEVEEKPLIFVGDSNTDINGIRYASQTGGYGIAVGETVEEARNRVDEASIYVGGGEDHHYTAALLNQITNTEVPTNQLISEIPQGDHEYGELLNPQQEERIEKELQEVEEILNE